MERSSHYRRYNLTIVVITVVSVILGLVFFFLVYRSYARAARKTQRAQQNLTNAAKGICSSILNPNGAGPVIRYELEGTAVGAEIETACRELLAS
jgi:CHASE3 domain sensor protein